MFDAPGLDTSVDLLARAARARPQAIADTVVADIVVDALAGLVASPKTLPPKLFYDAEGVRLFDTITRLPEYYLTRTERAVLCGAAADLAALVPAGATLVEYGACDEAKARLLLQAPGARFAAYVPIDVAGGALRALSIRLQSCMPALAVHPVCADFTAPLALPAAVSGTPCLGFFPGSTIGNLAPVEAVAFLAQARRALGPNGWLIVGADLCQDPALLLPAYNDAAGITAAFNLNVLRRLNREAGADFVLDRFEHRAVWNAAASRMEMHLRSRMPQRVRVGGTAIAFAAGETIHTENSYKHGEVAMRALATASGWSTDRVWTDRASLFAVFALRAAPVREIAPRSLA